MLLSWSAANAQVRRHPSSVSHPCVRHEGREWLPGPGRCMQADLTLRSVAADTYNVYNRVPEHGRADRRRAGCAEGCGPCCLPRDTEIRPGELLAGVLASLIRSRMTRFMQQLADLPPSSISASMNFAEGTRLLPNVLHAPPPPPNSPIVAAPPFVSFARRSRGRLGGCWRSKCAETIGPSLRHRRRRRAPHSHPAPPSPRRRHGALRSRATGACKGQEQPCPPPALLPSSSK